MIGRKIVRLVIGEDEDGDYPIGFQLDDDTVVWVLRDPEGNGPGFLEIDTSELKHEDPVHATGNQEPR